MGDRRSDHVAEQTATQEPTQETPQAQERELSAPELPAQGDAIGAVVYFSSASENTSRFIHSCKLEEQGINVYRIPMRPKDPALNGDEPHILVVPTYVQVKKFLNGAANRAGIRGVIASGNTNFGEAFCMAGDMVAAKCKVPFMYYFELMGTQTDREKVTRGVVDFFKTHQEK